MAYLPIGVTELTAIARHFSAISVLFSMADFSLDVVVENKWCCQKLEAEIKIICVEFRNKMAWQWAETLVETREALADIRGTTK